MRVKEHVKMDEAKRRALAFLATKGKRELVYASEVFVHIWPGSELRSQGAGGAASRILRQMRKEGTAEWVVFNLDRQEWGWRATKKGRDFIDRV